MFVEKTILRVWLMRIILPTLGQVKPSGCLCLQESWYIKS